MLYRVLMAFVFFSLNVVSRSVLFRSRVHPNVRMLVSRRNGRPSDFIDVEVDDKSESGRAGGEKFEALSKETREKKGLLSGVGGFLASKFPILKLINKSEDKESIQKREAKKQMNTGIDKMFEGSGALGFLVKGLVKTAAGAVVELAAQASKDFDLVKSTATLRMEQNDGCVNALGDVITIGPPTMSSSSSFSTSFSSEMSNGQGNTATQTQKQFAYVFPAEGDKGSANVRVQGSVTGSIVTFSEFTVQTSAGKTMQLVSGGGGGGRRGGGGRITTGNVIDVDVL